MSAALFELFNPFLSKKRKHHIEIAIVRKDDYAKWIGGQSTYVKTYAKECGFEGKTGQFLMVRDHDGDTQQIINGACEAECKIISYEEGNKTCEFVNIIF